MKESYPVELNKSPDSSLEICWSDGHRQKISFRALRDACQCAGCMEKKMKDDSEPVGSLPVLSPADTIPLDIQSMKPVGNYAYNIHFSDGHSTGIFTYELLRRLG